MMPPLLLLQSQMAVSVSLPPLVPCVAAARHGRMGLCVSSNGTEIPIVLRGANYIRLDSHEHFHSTFSPSDYNRTKFSIAMRELSNKGFNVVRVFVDHRTTTGIAGLPGQSTPLDRAYCSRLAQFVSDAAGYGLYTIVTLQSLPANAFFRNATRHMAKPSWNAQFLMDIGHSAWTTYSDALSATLASMLTGPTGIGEVASSGGGDSVLFSLQNELFLRGDEWPFNASAGLADTAAGAFDMAVPSERQRAADENTNRWADGCRGAVRKHLPRALVTAGVFTFEAVGKDGPDGLQAHDCNHTHDCRFPARPYWLSRSTLDWLDVHVYVPNALKLVHSLMSEEWSRVHASKPIVMGEFGCLGGLVGKGNRRWYATAAACAPHVAGVQKASCVAGFVGWLFWTYDTDDLAEQPQWFSMVDDHRAIETALAPANRTDPCS